MVYNDRSLVTKFKSAVDDDGRIVKFMVVLKIRAADNEDMP